MARKRIPTEAIRERVATSVCRIPSGRVSTYGAIADEHSLSPRQVAQVLASNIDDIPWHRVVKAGGVLAQHDGADEQQARLLEEGVEIRDGVIVGFRHRLFVT